MYIVVKSNICYRCGREMPYWYVEEGDLTISAEKQSVHAAAEHFMGPWICTRMKKLI